MKTTSLRIAIPAFSALPNYVAALLALGAEPVPVSEPPQPADYGGLLLPGGADVDPARYGEENAACRGVDPALDALQFGALDAFMRAGKPVLGICRGHQLLNVYLGGSLFQDLPTEPIRHPPLGAGPDGICASVHNVTAESGSRLAALYGTEFFVNSAHHQGVDRVGEGLWVPARAPDGVIEALVHRTLPVFSVQWHPERMCFARRRGDTVDGSLLIADFLRLCRG